MRRLHAGIREGIGLPRPRPGFDRCRRFPAQVTHRGSGKRNALENRDAIFHGPGDRASGHLGLRDIRKCCLDWQPGKQDQGNASHVRFPPRGFAILAKIFGRGVYNYVWGPRVRCPRPDHPTVALIRRYFLFLYISLSSGVFGIISARSARVPGVACSNRLRLMWKSRCCLSLDLPGSVS